MRILQIANYQEGVGGISVQVQLLRENLRNEGFTCDILSTKGGFLKRIHSVITLLRKGNGYDVFHIHACSDRGFLPAVLGVSVGRLMNKQIVLTYHGGGAESFLRRRAGFVKFFLKRVRHNIVLSGFVGEVFDRYGIQYSIIPNVLESSVNVFKERSVINPRFISIRSLTETYNVECTLRAFRLVQERYPSAELTVLGDGPLRNSLMGYVNDHSIQHVFFVGQIPNSEIYQYLDKADIMVSSSRFDNMPVSILEGFRAGLLVVASNVGGVPYMIEDGWNGMLFESNNDKRMAERMIEAVEFQDASLRMIENAHCSLEKYRWEHCREKLLKLYED